MWFISIDDYEEIHQIYLCFLSFLNLSSHRISYKNRQARIEKKGWNMNQVEGSTLFNIRSLIKKIPKSYLRYKKELFPSIFVLSTAFLSLSFLLVKQNWKKSCTKRIFLRVHKNLIEHCRM